MNVVIVKLVKICVVRMNQKLNFIFALIISSTLFQLFWYIARFEEENSLFHNLINKFGGKENEN